MEEREENRHERLKQQLRELEEEWTAMKTGKRNSSAVSWITMEKALEIVKNSPRNLMLSLQHDPEMMQIKSPSLRRKLFHDSEDDDDDDQTNTKTSSSLPSCLSSNVMMRASVNNNKKKEKKKKRGRIVSVTMVVLLVCVLAVLMNHLSMNTQITTLVPT